ncbi:MAG: SPOR domain-containing protein [Parapedobacter sp.]
MSIANLLRRYPAVGVPGIGVFRKTHQPASYDTEKSAFLPPIDYIELVEDQAGVFQLTTYLEAQERLDAAAAEAMLEDAVAAIMDTISRNGEAWLDGLGYLLADGASFIFKPFEIDGFAAMPITAQPPAASVVEDVVTPVDEVVTVPDETELSVDMVAAEPTGQPSALEEVAGGDSSGKRYTPWIIGGVVAAMLIAVVAIWSYQRDRFGGTSTERTTGIDNQAILSTAAEGTTEMVEVAEDSTASDSNAVVAGGDPIPVDSVPVTSTPPSKPSVTYEIIVGSFATMRQADKFVAEMKAKGYDLQAIDSKMPGNRKKISWGSYATEEEAYKELARVQKTFEPGAWIAKIVHN